MRILLLGEYSNVHATLARGLSCLGHEVTVASNGDFWKDYPRDTDLSRRPGRWGGLQLMAKLMGQLPRWRGYDIVQLINPMFVELTANRITPLYHFLRRFNRRVVLGAFGMDYYWVRCCVEDKRLRYSDFNIGSRLRTDADALRERSDWCGTAKERLNRLIATTCDSIVAGLYEYWVSYQPLFPDKTTFIPYPIEMPQVEPKPFDGTLRLFIGINEQRSTYKGTDVMLAAAEAVAERHPGRVELRVARSVPFDEYRRMMEGSDAILDQLYSYTPSMNPLLAMSKGIICIGGGEPEHYELLGERQLRPIVNVEPSYESVTAAIEGLLAHPEQIDRMKHESQEYVRRHHDFMSVARRYENIYQQKKGGI